MATTRNVRQRLVAIGIKRLGEDELAKRLNVTRIHLEEWQRGDAVIPDRTLVKLIDVIDALGALGDEA